jgi:hypothetical protein
MDGCSSAFEMVTYSDHIPRCDVLVIIKYNLPHEIVRRVSENAAVVFAPIDYYGSSAEVDRDYPMLSRCARIVIHSRSLRKYFQSYAPVEYLDHHVKYAAPMPRAYRQDGPVLWVGMQNNLPPLVDWVNEHHLPGDLWLLTNQKDTKLPLPSAADLGFRNNGLIRIEAWSANKHIAWTKQARCAIDVKGTAFRARHKPPAKAIDFIASGVPLAMNSDSNSVRHLAELGFEVAAPEDSQRWLSREYWEETRRFGRALRTILSRTFVGRRWQRLLRQVVLERNRALEAA